METKRRLHWSELLLIMDSAPPGTNSTWIFVEISSIFGACRRKSSEKTNDEGLGIETQKSMTCELREQKRPANTSLVDQTTPVLQN